VARKVEQFPEAPNRSIYPWHDWLDGDIWELTQGVDFKGSAATFRTNARSQAKRRNGKIKARVVRGSDGADRVYVQFTREPIGGSNA
jgi:hypothetical protein